MSAADQDIRLEDLERAVFARDHEAACRLLIPLLRAMTSRRPGHFVRNDGQTTLTLDEESQVLTRLAGAMVALMADPRMQLSQPGYEAILTTSAQAGAIFELSGYGSSEHLWRLLFTRDASGAEVFTEEALRKGFALATLSSTPPEVVRSLERLPRNIAIPALLGLLANPIILHERANTARNEALRLGHLLADVTFSDVLAELAMLPWMLCSYADIPDKHTIKAEINRALRRWMGRRGIPLDRTPTPPARERPVVAVMLEWAHAEHAMMRCYGSWLASLRRDFHTIGFAAKGAMDAATRALFDEVREIEPGLSALGQTIATVEACQPDIVYYPSVGMAGWAICLANLRLAPLQCMSLGHPATSRSDEMDVAITVEGVNFDPDRFSEKMVVLQGAGAAFELRPDMPAAPPVIREHPDVVRIAVPAKLFKLSPAFLGACREIADRASRKVEFYFFPNEIGTSYALARQRIEALIPEARVFPTMRYVAYLEHLDACDIALGAFTFGNTNSAVDALLRALPVVALDGPEVHEGSEQQVMRPVGLPEWLIARNIPEYIGAVLRLVDNDEERVALSRSLVGRMEAVLRAESERRQDFADAMLWMHRHRAELRTSTRKLWPMRELLPSA